MRALPGLEASTRLYSALLHLYPRSFRDRFGADAVALFRDRYTEVWAERGRRGVAALWIRTLGNVLLNGPAERIAMARVVRPGRGHLAVSGAWRSLVRSPWLPGVVVLTLGLGIGSTVALYSVLRGVLIRPLPFSEPDRLVRIHEIRPGGGVEEVPGVSPWNFVDWDERVEGVSAMTAWYLTSGTFRIENAVEEIRGAQVTADFFEVFDVAPKIGRTFRREEIARYGPILLSEATWERLYGRAPDIVGQPVSVSGVDYQVVGIVPRGFTFPDPSVGFWLAWDMAAVYAGRPETRTWRFLRAAARLEPGVGLDDAERAFATQAAALAEAHPAENRDWTVDVAPLHEDLVGGVRGALWVAFGAVSLLLLIACSNVANLLLARVPERSREMAIRSSLGASRGDQIATLVVESAALGLAGGALGLVVGATLLNAFVRLGQGRVPRIEEVTIDVGVVAFTLAVALATSLIFGLTPALHALRSSTAGTLRAGSRTSGSAGAQRARQVFVAAQVAVAISLLTGAALFRTSLARIVGVDDGFETEGAVTFRVSVDTGPEGPAATSQYYRDLIEDLSGLPGVTAVGGAQTLPLDPVAGDFERPYRPLGASIESAEAPPADMRIATRGFLAALGVPLIEGSDFTGTEAPGDPPVAIVNRTLARRLWPDGDAVGRAFELDWPSGWQAFTIVGVAADVRHDDPRMPAREEVYVPHGWIPYQALSLVVRTSGDPAELVPSLRATVAAQSRIQPAYNFATLEDLRSTALGEERFLSWLLQVFSGIGLALVSVGVYGVVAYSVSHRKREIGVRMALGARPASVALGVLSGSMLMTALGTAIGLVVVRVVSGPVDSLLFGVTASDPRAVAIGVGSVIGIAAVASLLPALRAARVPPAVALAGD